jgi:hypothetical protein
VFIGNGNQETCLRLQTTGSWCALQGKGTFSKIEPHGGCKVLIFCTSSCTSQKSVKKCFMILKESIFPVNTSKMPESICPQQFQVERKFEELIGTPMS